MNATMRNLVRHIGPTPSFDHPTPHHLQSTRPDVCALTAFGRPINDSRFASKASASDRWLMTNLLVRKAERSNTWLLLLIADQSTNMAQDNTPVLSDPFGQCLSMLVLRV